EMMQVGEIGEGGRLGRVGDDRPRHGDMRRKPDGDGRHESDESRKPEHQPHHGTHRLASFPSSLSSRAAGPEGVAFPSRDVIRFFTENDYSPLVNKEGGLDMNLSPPSTAVFVISLILAALAIIG